MSKQTEQQRQVEQAKEDLKITVESTEQMIDMHFTEFAEFLEGKNIGELKGFRTLMQMHLDKADILAKKLVDSKLSGFGKEERIKVGSVFGAVSKIVDRMGYIDYLIQKNSIKF